jgi:hypothetical protein
MTRKSSPSATNRSATAEAAPVGGPMAENSQEGTGAFSTTPMSMGWQAESCLMADRWNFRLLV